MIRIINAGPPEFTKCPTLWFVMGLFWYVALPATGNFPHFFKQLEHYTFYGLVGAIPKEVLILARRHEYLLAVDGKARVLNLH